jgi:hypothetical protein
VFRQEAVLPVEVNLQVCRVAQQDQLSAEVYGSLMMDRLDEAMDNRFQALNVREKEKLRIAKAYNKKVKIVLSGRFGVENNFAIRIRR